MPLSPKIPSSDWVQPTKENFVKKFQNKLATLKDASKISICEIQRHCKKNFLWRFHFRFKENKLWSICLALCSLNIKKISIKTLENTTEQADNFRNPSSHKFVTNVGYRRSTQVYEGLISEISETMPISDQKSIL